MMVKRKQKKRKKKKKKKKKKTRELGEVAEDPATLAFHSREQPSMRVQEDDAAECEEDEDVQDVQHARSAKVTLSSS